MLDNSHSAQQVDDMNLHFTVLFAAMLLIFMRYVQAFFWKVTSVSVLLLWIYPVFIFPWRKRRRSGTRGPAGSGNHIIPIAIHAARVLGFLILLVWCAMLTPMQLFVPTPMDAWIKYMEHPPFRPFEVLHQHEKPVAEYVHFLSPFAFPVVSTEIICLAYL